MPNKLLYIYKKQQFIPNVLSIFINPFYFIRKGLFEKISENASQLNGTLLDFGCGAKPYKELFNVEKYIGVDIMNKAHLHGKKSLLTLLLMVKNLFSEMNNLIRFLAAKYLNIFLILMKYC